MLPKAFRSRTKIRLGDFRALRAELCVVYRACVRGDLDWADGRAATAILSAIGNLDRDVDFAERLAVLEERLDVADAPPAPTNGQGGIIHARH